MRVSRCVSVHRHVFVCMRKVIIVQKSETTIKCKQRKTSKQDETRETERTVNEEDQIDFPVSFDLINNNDLMISCCV